MTGAERARASRLRRKKRRSADEQRELEQLESRAKRRAALKEPELVPDLSSQDGPNYSRISEHQVVDSNATTDAGTWSPAGEPSPAAEPAPADAAPAAEPAPAGAALDDKPPAAEPAAPDPEALERGVIVVASILCGFVEHSMAQALVLVDRNVVTGPVARVFGALREEPARAKVLSVFGGAATSCARRYLGGNLAYLDEVVVLSTLGVCAAIQARAAKLPPAPAGA